MCQAKNSIYCLTLCLYDVKDDTLFKISALSLVLKCVLRWAYHKNSFFLQISLVISKSAI